MDVNSTVLQNMTLIRRKCFPLFSFMHFIAWLIPWPWDCDSWIYNQVPTQASFCGESYTSEAQTNEFLSVCDSDLEYLTQEEAEQIVARFMEIPQSYDRLVFWTGIPREWVQQWADDHSMLTFSSAMGPLMDSTDDRCLRRIKKRKQWMKYIKGACGIFARYACKRGIVRVVTLPPSWAEFIRPESTYRNIEEPVLKGRSGCCCAVQINTVHLLTTLGELEYQTWPQEHIPEKLRCRGAATSNFRLPTWSRKALKAATKSLRSSCVSSTVVPAPKPANVNVVFDASVKITSGPQSTERPNGGMQSRDSTNAQGHSRLQSQQPQSKRRPQITQTTSKKKQLQALQASSKKEQPQTQQSAINSEQLQKQQPSNRKQQPQSKKQQSQSKKQRPQSQQTSSKNKKPQTQRLLSKNKKPQTQQSSNKKQQTQKQQSQKQQSQKQQSQKQQSQRQQSQKQQSQNQQPQSKKSQPQNSRQP